MNNETPDYWVEGGAKARKAESGGRGVVIDSYANGWKLKVTAEKPSVRNNNPGNVRYYDPVKVTKEGKENALQRANRDHALFIDKDGFGVYPDWLTGKRAADAAWERARKKKTIKEMATRYTATEQEQRINDLVKETAGWVDRDGNPVNENTPLSKLTDEQFITLRNYNNMQSEGWLNNIQKSKIEWIPPSQGAHAPAGAGTRQRPAGRVPVPASPAKPHSSLEAPPSTSLPAAFHMGTPDQSMPIRQPNRLLSYDPSQGFPMPPANPLTHYADGMFPSSFPSLTENPTIPALDDILRPNLLTAPSKFDFFSSGKGNPPRLNAQSSGQPKRTPEVPVSQASKVPFHSPKDKLDFLGQVYRVAKPVSEATGLSLPFILAHAAHEVDFGKNIEGNNLFNLKADKDWEGPTYTRADETYRSYPSYEESMDDYLAHLQGNPRYGEMFEPVTRGSLGMLADAIHHAGYSDDPLYTFRILGAAQDPIMKRAIWQYQHWPPEE